MQSQGIKARYIRQIKLAGHKLYFPNKYFSPYDFLTEVEAAARKKYEIRVVEVRYIVSKSKNLKDIDDHFTIANLTTEDNYNNVFSINDDFIKRLLSDSVLLVPPQDFDPNKFDQENNAAKKQIEDRKNQQVDAALKLLMQIHLLTSPKDFKLETRSLTRFRKEIQPALRDSEVDIYIKVVTNGPTEDAIEKDKNSKSPVVVATNTKQEIRVHLHPVKADPQSVDLLAKLSPITDWSLCALNPQKRVQGMTYWSIPEISRKLQEINQSIKVLNYVSVHRNKKGNLDYFQIYSFLFNEIVLKAVVHLAQIKRVELWTKGEEDAEYYLHLAYPPKFYVSLLKPDVGCDDGFIRNWQRVQNFTFLRNPTIMKDQFLRLYLFNNTIVRMRLSNKDQDVQVNAARELLYLTLDRFKGTIKIDSLASPYDLGRKLTNLSTIFKYSNFKGKFQYALTNTLTIDKLWKLKYLLIVLVRHNRLMPSEIQKILNHIEKAKEDIDIYIYIFWQKVVLLNAVSPQGSDWDCMAELDAEFTQIKKLSIGDITRRVSSNTDQIAYIFKASLTPSGYLYNPPTPEMKGRLMKEYSSQSQHFLRVTVTDDNEGTLKNQKYITKFPLKKMMQHIPILQRFYIPLGWSPSQLRSYSLWYMHEVNVNRSLIRQQVLSFLGDFDHIDNHAKKAARIGQAFSSSWTYECKAGEIKEIRRQDDLSSKGYMYTDGIGKLSADLLQRISLKLQIKDLSVVQVRYKGAKGILVLDPTLPPRTVVLRKSMIKYECKHDSAEKYLDILDWNKYKAGFLNRQTIILLKSLGISDKAFEKKHNQHINRLSNMSFKDCSIFKHMNEELNTDISNLQPANVTILHLLRAGFKLENEPFFRGVLQTMKKNGYHQLKVKSNILIEKSARIIGIIDEWDILQEGELFCTVFDNIDLQPRREHVAGPVVITRNPCLHPADIRKMICVSEQQVQARFKARGEDNLFQNYVNCLIFPKKGDIPVTSQISGSDLDGDNFFICWDPQLIPQNHEEIYVIDAPNTNGGSGDKAGRVKSENSAQMYEEMLNFFVEYLNYEKLGQIDNSHLVHADRSPFYAKVKECVQLAIAHGKAVDFPKSGFCPQVDPRLLVSTYPDFMQKEESPQYVSESILGRLYRDIKERIKNLLESCQTQKTSKIDEQVIRQLTIGQNVKFQSAEIRQAIDILQSYERELAGLITLVGVDTEYEIYSGNFSIAKDKVKSFGKNRLIATILTLRARFFDEFFNNARDLDKEVYLQAKEQQLQKTDLFAPTTRRRALLFYLTSYLMKYCEDESFLNDAHFAPLRHAILGEFKSKTYAREGKFCGFVWFVIPKIMINQKYRIRKLAQLKAQEGVLNEEQEEVEEPEEEVI